MCTIIAAGKKATADGSILVSHSDAGKDSRVRIIERASYPEGSQANVYWGLQEIRNDDLNDFGEVLGQIPQVKETFRYFHSAYSHINEHQLVIAESTISQKEELVCSRDNSGAIITAEQAMIFALQRCKTAQQAIYCIAGLMETYGFLPSCVNGAEAFCIADPDEIWVMEVVGVGPNWQPNSGKPGAIWVARKLQNDEALIIANWSIIREIDDQDTENFIVSKHYKSEALNRGWYDDCMAKPFIWQEIYCPVPREWATERLWLFYSSIAPSYTQWPDRKLEKDKFKTLDQYGQYVEPLSLYPFSVKPEIPLTVEFIKSFQRSVFENTIYDITEQPQWYVLDNEGNTVKSPLATPFPSNDLRRLLKLSHRRTVARHFGYYGMICQLREKLPDDIACIYWIYLDNPQISAYLPLYLGVKSIHPAYQIYNPEVYSDESARWTIDFVDNMVQMQYQDAIKDVKAAIEIFEKKIADEMQLLEQKIAINPDCENLQEEITGFCKGLMSQVPALYVNIRNQLIVKYTNNKK
ncbi:dipeptidase [Solitalea lacus]|uniref:dipeptidase n=1 Tax=Solitalea lacus TaxID=2911172 RepID=UPI001EDC872B|nr:C69 family dipeptidase [Solitalea lacus]UKJ09158.1 C69 family dipeptidase [Solitalea lacus]